jgi:single-strand DNA-binding protein
MNKVILMGRLTRDPEVRYTDGGSSIVRFSLAVDRKFKREGEEQTADFINCVAFGKTAEFIEKYFFKGAKMLLEGRIQTGSYEKDGQRIYTTDIVVEQVEFAESKAASNNSETANAQSPKRASEDGFMNIPDGIDEELPFN